MQYNKPTKDLVYLNDRTQPLLLFDGDRESTFFSSWLLYYCLYNSLRSNNQQKRFCLNCTPPSRIYVHLDTCRHTYHRCFVSDGLPSDQFGWKNQIEAFSKTYFMQGRQIVPSFSIVSAFICNQQMEPCSLHSVSSAICCSPLVCETPNHLILKFKSGRGSLWWKIVIWEKGKSRAGSPILKKDWVLKEIVLVSRSLSLSLSVCAAVTLPSITSDLKIT